MVTGKLEAFLRAFVPAAEILSVSRERPGRH